MDYPAGSHHYAPGLLGASSQAREGGLDSSVGDSVGLAGEHSGLPRVPTTTLIRVRAAQALGPVWSGPNRRRLGLSAGYGSWPHLIPQFAAWPARVARPRPSATRSVWRASDPGRSATSLLHPSGPRGACPGPVRPGPNRRRLDLSAGYGHRVAHHIIHLRHVPPVGGSDCRRAVGSMSQPIPLFGLPAQPARRAPPSFGRGGLRGSWHCPPEDGLKPHTSDGHVAG